MPLPPCHSRRETGNRNRLYYCAHPDVHIQDQIVTAEICGRCPHADGPAPQRFRSFPHDASRFRIRRQSQLVVARFREDLSWLETFKDIPTIVYDKGDPNAQFPLENVGREAHTYLSHIVRNYDCLADITIFLQGNPRDHISDLTGKVWGLGDDISFQDLCDQIIVEDQNGHPVHHDLPIGEFYEKLFGEPCPDYIMCHTAACFAVARENILNRPKSFYEHALQLVTAEKLGPWVIERLWQFVFRRTVPTEGIVTAADSAFFEDLQYFVTSLRQRNQHPLVVFDLGLNWEQQAWCRKQPLLTCLPVPPLWKRAQAIRRQHWWQTWLKPMYIFQSPFDRVMWIDADCVVLDDLSPAFELLNDMPLLVRDGTSASTKNDTDLYQHLPVKPGVAIEQISVNAGVVGICKHRDQALLDTWAFGVQWAALNPRLQGHVAWADQGILHWAIQRTGYSHTVQDELSWNFPAGEARHLLASSIMNGQSLIDELKDRYQDARILHWYGIFKLSGQLGDEIAHLWHQPSAASLSSQ